MESNYTSNTSLKELKEIIKVPAVLVKKNETTIFLIKHKDLLLTMKKTKLVIPKDKDYNLILLTNELTKDEILMQLPPNSQLEEYNFIKDYKYYTYQELLKKIIKEDNLIPSSFEVIGDIAIINLKTEEQNKYKKIIGESIILTNSQIKAIYSKTEKLDNVFRTPILELIGGVDKKETIVKEQSVKLKLNVEEVYYCSRLHFERNRVNKKYIKNFDTIVDVFCGVGPFSIMMAKEKKCKVFANDLNPNCFKYLQDNISLNKVHNYVVPYCKDGHDFINNIFDEVTNKKILTVQHFYMNLPALAIDFLVNFQNTPDSLLNVGFFIHVYCFQEKQKNEEDFIQSIKERIKGKLGFVFQFSKFEEFQFVKNVSAQKIMMCATIKMQKYIDKEKTNAEEKKSFKKLKTN